MRAIGDPFSAAEMLAFIAAARACIGVRWRHQGRSLRGVDCGGLVVFALRAVGRSVSDSTAYGREPYRGSLEATLRANFGEPLPADQMQLGDVVLMRFAGEPSHVGILGDYLYGGLSLIHAYAKGKKVIEHRLDDEWRGYIVEVYRP